MRHNIVMRATRVIYVENDPALMGIFGSLLEQQPGIDIVKSCTSSTEALNDDTVDTADVALLDLGLGYGSMNGIDLGIAMRQRNPNLGIVIHSQHEVGHVLPLIPQHDSMAWSYIPKTGDMSVSRIVTILKSTAAGQSIGMGAEPVEQSGSVAELSDRQRAVMALAASGLGAPEIARRLNSSHEAVRQELTRAYRILVPTMGDGEDRRTRAVIAYLHLVKPDTWIDS